MPHGDLDLSACEAGHGGQGGQCTGDGQGRGGDASKAWPDTQRVHVGIGYMLRARSGSHIPTLRPKYLRYSYMDPLG